MSSTASLVCKKLCLCRVLCAVTLNLFTQCLLLTLFLLFVNFHILHLVNWISETVAVIFNFYTWISVLPLMVAIVLYGMLLGKSLLAVKVYYTTRFKWLLGTSMQKFVFFLAHILVGLLTTWLYTRFLHVDYKYLIFKCYGTDCINPHYTFLIFAGVMTSCYFFIKEYLRQEPELEFPIVQQPKLIRARSLFFNTLYKSFLHSFLPTMVFGVVYWLLGGLVNRRLASILNVEVDELLTTFFATAGNLRLLFYTWLLSAEILSTLNLLQHFCGIFLAERLRFVVDNQTLYAQVNNEIGLAEALAMTHLPLVQHLAAYELYYIATNQNPDQRQIIYALSVPGGHPHNWQQLSTQCLSLINAYTDELVNSFKHISIVKTSPLLTDLKSTCGNAPEKILLRQYNEMHGVRRMAAKPPTSPASPTTTCTVTHKKPTSSNSTCRRYTEQLEHLSRQLEQTVRGFFYAIPGLSYLFGELDGAKTAFLLSNSQAVVWVTQGLAAVCAASLLEDKYGVVQTTLPQILKSLLRLKLQLDKLNNVNLNGKKPDRNLITLKHAVKRSLHMICDVFCDYLRDLVDEPEDLRQLQIMVSYQEA